MEIKIKKQKAPVEIILHAVYAGAVFLTWIYAFYNTGCRNPNDNEPPEDTLVAPPAAPLLNVPLDSFVFMPRDIPWDAILDWDTVSAAEKYELEITRGGEAPYAIMLDYDSSIYRIYNDTMYFQRHLWRVRAISSKWTGSVTEWSEQRVFKVRWPPPPPALLLPPDGTVFYSESLPVYLNCRWDTVSDEQYYEIKFSRDTIVLEQSYTSSQQYDFAACDTGTYFWTVRAGSNLWERYTDWAVPWTFSVVDTTQPGDWRRR